MPLRLRPDIATADTGDGLILLDERTGAGHHPAHIAQNLATRYHIDSLQAHPDVTAITQRLHAAKLVQPS